MDFTFWAEVDIKPESSFSEGYFYYMDWHVIQDI